MSFFHSLLGQTAISYPTYQTDSDVVLQFDTHNPSTMMTTTSIGSDANTEPVVTNTVGHLYSVAAGGMFMATASNAAGKPTLNSDGMLAWGGTLLRLVSSALTGWRTYLKPMHAAASVWSLRYKISHSSDGVLKTHFFTRSTAGTTSAGLTLNITTGNKLQIIQGDGTSNKINYTSTQSITAAMGICWIQIVANGASGTLYITSTSGGVDISENFSISNGANADCSVDFQMGALNTAIGQVKLVNRVWTSDEITAFKSYSPSVTSDYWYSQRIKFDYDSSAYGDTSLTTPSTNGGIVRALKNLITWPTGYDPGWIFQAAADASSPDYATGVLNGHAAVQYDGTETQSISLMTAQGGVNPENNGRIIHFRVAKNLDADEGSHLGVGQNYYGFSGSNYASNPGGLAYLFIHAVSGSSPTAVTLKTDAQVANLVCIQRAGSDWSLWNGNKTSVDSTLSNAFTITEVGPRYSSVPSDWAFEGDDYYWEVGAGYVPDSYIEHRIDLLNAAYAI